MSLPRDSREDDARLELQALAALGLAVEPPPGADLPLGRLAAAGLLAPHQVQAVRSFLAVHVVACACGRRALRASTCAACGARTPGSGPAAQAAPRALGPGSRVGPLVLEERLGAGAQAAVYRARHEQLGRACAVKVLHAARPDPRLRRRFEREGEALARLRHRAVVSVHALHELEDGTLACEMELVEGETLEARLERSGPLPWREAAALVAELARGLQAAHDASVLHRDLKPANVLLRAADGQALVTDFGLARLSDATSSLTAAGTVLGTPCFMAPEALSGTSDAPAVDVYGLGAVLYAALTARAPYEATTLPELLAAVASGRCAPTAAPGPLERVRARAMSPRPGDRHASALALANDLEAVLAGRDPGAPSRGRRALRALLALGAAGVLVGALAGALSWTSRRAGEARFAGALCRDLLGRPADPEALDELRLEPGAPREDVVRRVLASEGHLARHVELEFRQLLRRGPSASERAEWVRRLRGGATFRDLAVALLGSREYRDELAPARWVAQLYRDVLEREPDPAGAEEHVADFARNGDVDLRVRAIVVCPEAHERWVSAAWRRFLRREPTPDELAAERARLDGGAPLEETWVRVLASPEYPGGD